MLLGGRRCPAAMPLRRPSVISCRQGPSRTWPSETCRLCATPAKPFAARWRPCVQLPGCRSQGVPDRARQSQVQSQSLLKFSAGVLTHATRRNTVPEDHPLCHSSAAGSIPAQAAQLAQLHRRLRSGKVTHAGIFDDPLADPRAGLRTTVNHQGRASLQVLCAGVACLKFT